jgi:hypothetical protein
MSRFRSSRKLFTVATSLVVVLLAITLAPAQSLQVVGFRAGTNAFPIGSAGITVVFSVPMPTAQYSVVVQPTNTAGYSGTTACTYFNVLHKTTANFQVQHKRCDNGVPVNLVTGVSLDWIAWSHN